MTKVSELMTRDVKTLRPQDTIATAAKLMADHDVGAIPVCDGDTLLAMVTDRDIVVRGVALGLDGQTTPLSTVMSKDLSTVDEHADVSEVFQEMSARQIRRMPVINGQKKLVGIVSLGDLAVKDRADDSAVADSLRDISQP
ncbi:MAG: CBS domain-containing protein [Bdellovibrionales bacterium]|nr:CBS domain-containing protein [Ramlibacter sp.]